MPLSGVAARISDDTCSAVTYVSGDEDLDGLLDTINSIFEDALDETWTFTCTTTVSETTTNVVTVQGSPTGPDGAQLCGPSAGLILAIAQPCDVTDQATATVLVSLPAPVETTTTTTTTTTTIASGAGAATTTTTIAAAGGAIPPTGTRSALPMALTALIRTRSRSRPDLAHAPPGSRNYGSIRTPGLRIALGSRVFFTARSASAKSSGRWRS